MSTETELLEYEAEATRARLAATAGELRARLTPGHALDEILAYGRDSGAGEFVRNLGREVSRNPLPVTLAGAGLAWLMLARNGAGRGESPAHKDIYSADGDSSSELRARIAAARESLAQTAADFRGDVAEGSDRAVNYVSEQAHAAVSGISSMATSARDTTASAYRSVSEHAQAAGTAFGDKARNATGRANELGRSVISLCKEQPLVLAGVGIALGALVGALLPRTETEDRLVGEAADNLKQTGSALAEDAYETVKATGGEAAGMAEQRPAQPDEEPAVGRMPTGSERGLT